ncbi:MAG: hypothetical protein IPN79_02530 [Saprospiraceae bacterium]|nr:hypothetical protein [Saprospiraceae bacterium]
MKTQSSKTIVLLVALAITMVSLSSCNRGYGCPYELKSPVSILKIK